MKVMQMNQNIYLTWTFRVLQTIMFEGLDMYSKRIAKVLPFDHQDFAIHLDSMTASTFALNKNGTGLSGIETAAYSRCAARWQADTAVQKC